MREPTSADWDSLEGFAQRIGVPGDRVAAVRKRPNSQVQRPGSPYILLAARPVARLDLLLARWLAPKFGEALRAGANRPLVIGPKPANVRPALGSWPGLEQPLPFPGHLIVITANRRPSADLRAQLGSLGLIDELVWVVGLNQPFHEDECELPRSLVGHATTSRALIVGLSGEEVTPDEIAEVTALGINHLRAAGFNGSRCLGAGVWFPGSDARPGTVADLGGFLACDTLTVESARPEAARFAIAELLSKMAPPADSSKPPPYALIAIDQKEQEQLAIDLAKYLGSLGKSVAKRLEMPDQSDEQLRTFALSQLRGWGAYLGLEGHWMKYVETLRPGALTEMLAEAERILVDLKLRPGEIAATEVVKQRSPLDDLVAAKAKRAVLGIVVGVLCYLGVSFLLTQGFVALPNFVASALSVLALVAGLIWGYLQGRMFFAPPSGTRMLSNSSAPVLDGWATIERHMVAWFREFIVGRSKSHDDEYRELARRFDFSEVRA